MSNIIEIQLYDSKTGFFENCPIGKLNSKEITIGGEFKILVDGKTVYQNGGANG